MAVHATPTQAPADYDRYAEDDERGYGWVMFAGVLLLMLGTINFIEGLAAIGNAHFFTANAHYIAGSLNTWGWVVLCIGVLEWAVGVGVFVKNQFSRCVGGVVLAGNAIVQLMMLPAYPFWSLTIFTLDILAIYGLIAYGTRIFQHRLSAGLSTSPPARRDDVFFRSSRHEPADEDPRVAGINDAGTDETKLRRTQQLVEWRRAAQRVTREWNAWLAAESRDRALRYHVFVAALADEERAAAEVERMVDLADAGGCVTPTEPRNGRLGAR